MTAMAVVRTTDFQGWVIGEKYEELDLGRMAIRFH
jgi:hypothetical protein